MIGEDELRRYNREELIGLINRLQNEKLNMLHEHSNKMKEVNRRLQTHLLEIRGLKEVNRKLQDDNQELRDLCCFLDDDRQKCRKLSKEWQRFGRYTSSVIKSEVASSQKSIQDLTEKQQTVLKDNEELKELVMYLDEQQRVTAMRDQGDGSSSGASDDNTQLSKEPHIPSVALSNETVGYIQHLEERIDQLEEQLNSRHSSTRMDEEAVTQALKVLEVHNQIEKPLSETESLGTDEKLILRELCNVAWRQLEEKTPKLPSRTVPQNSRV